MGGMIILPLNCKVDYYEYDPKVDESYIDVFYLVLRKVAKRAVLIEGGDPWEGREGHKCWLPKRFIKRVFKKETGKGGCWFMEVDYEGYCKYREWLVSNKRNIAGLCGCAFLDINGYETIKGVVYPIYDIKPFEGIEEKPKPVKELEKLLTEFGIKG